MNVILVVSVMTDNEKNECKRSGYTCDSNGNLQACDGKCDTCDFSYDYVIGYYEGYDACYNEYH